MKKYVVYLITKARLYNIELPEDATLDEIEEAAKVEAFKHVDWGWMRVENNVNAEENLSRSWCDK